MSRLHLSFTVSNLIYQAPKVVIEEWRTFTGVLLYSFFNALCMCVLGGGDCVCACASMHVSVHASIHMHILYIRLMLMYVCMDCANKCNLAVVLFALYSSLAGTCRCCSACGLWWGSEEGSLPFTADWCRGRCAVSLPMGPAWLLCHMLRGKCQS